MHLLIQSLPSYDRKGIFDSILRDLSRKYLQSSTGISTDQGYRPMNDSTIGGVAAMVSGLVRNDSLLEAHMVHWLTSMNGEYAGLGLETRRAVIATLASNQRENS